MERLQKYIASSGYTSRRKAEDLPKGRKLWMPEIKRKLKE